MCVSSTVGVYYVYLRSALSRRRIDRGWRIVRGWQRIHNVDGGIHWGMAYYRGRSVNLPEVTIPISGHKVK